jgi:hypothetical protein
MGLLDMSAEIEVYFIDNWSDTVVQFPDRDFDTDSLDEYIELNFAPTQNILNGFNGTSQGRIQYNGMSLIGCYHKNKKKALELADTVGAFLNGKELPYNINIGIPQPKEAIDLGNDFWLVRVLFTVKQD